tara:strand:- start:215 stop:652 length:438 start_codon:yes stop_codon:yes gene_type:complete
MKKTDIKLNQVTLSDSKFLYELLMERDPTVNISHKQLPDYEQHKKFIKSSPYSKWYIINYCKRKIGSIYLSKQNEIGIFLKKDFQGKHFGKLAFDLLVQKNPRKRYLANVNPKNKDSQKFFKTNSFRLIQYTYELIPKVDSKNEN